MPGPSSLEVRVAALPDAVDAQLRTEVGQLLRTLRIAKNPIAVLLSLSRLSLRLVRLIYEKAGHTAPSDNLYDCLVVAGRGDPDRKQKGLRIVPEEIITGLHTVRTLSNKSDHAAETVVLSGADAENVLGLYLRALEWFYYEADFGPRLTRPAGRPAWCRWGRPLSVAVAVGACLLAYIAWNRSSLFLSNPSHRSGTLAAVPPPVHLPSWTAAFPAAPVLDLIAQGQPPAAPDGFVRPRFSLDLLGRRQGQKDFQVLGDGDVLASRVDDYLLVVRPQTAGHLYIFQIDSRGTLTWLFPANATSKISSGVNPVPAGKRLLVPEEERQTALYLDTNVGFEHIVAVYSAVRWPQLEDALRKAASTRHEEGNAVPEALVVTRGVEEQTRAPEGARPIGEEGKKAVEVAIGGDDVRLHLAARPQSATGSFLVVSRWVRHIAPQKR